MEKSSYFDLFVFSISYIELTVMGFAILKELIVIKSIFIFLEYDFTLL